jgi:methylglutaconyl-CoA hydratase
MKFIKKDLNGALGTLTLNRPDVRNAFHPEMIRELTEAFRELTASSVRVVLLRGEGKSFCAGADLEWMKSMAQFSREQNLADAGELFNLFETAKFCLKPMIGMVQGHAMGGALGLLAVCDFVLAESRTQFCFSEVKLGLVPAVISSFVLEKMQPSRARAAMLTGELFSAEQARDWGLVSFVGSQAECEAEKERLLKLFQNAAPQAVAATKELCLYHPSHSPDEIRRHSIEVIADRRVSSEGQDGLSSFFQGRKPQWQNEEGGD